MSHFDLFAHPLCTLVRLMPERVWCLARLVFGGHLSDKYLRPFAVTSAVQNQRQPACSSNHS